jgi:hypothetical protein
LPAWHRATSILLTFRVSLGGIYVGITKVIIGVVNILSDGASIRWDSKKRFSMIVSLLSKEAVGDLRTKMASEMASEEAAATVAQRR